MASLKLSFKTVRFYVIMILTSSCQAVAANHQIQQQLLQVLPSQPDQFGWKDDHYYDFLLRDVNRCDFKRIDLGNRTDEELGQLAYDIGMEKVDSESESEELQSPLDLRQVLNWDEPMMFLNYNGLDKGLLRSTRLTKANMLKEFGDKRVTLSNAITYSHDKKYCSFREYVIGGNSSSQQSPVEYGWRNRYSMNQNQNQKNSKSKSTQCRISQSQSQCKKVIVNQNDNPNSIHAITSDHQNSEETEETEDGAEEQDENEDGVQSMAIGDDNHIDSVHSADALESDSNTNIPIHSDMGYIPPLDQALNLDAARTWYLCGDNFWDEILTHWQRPVSFLPGAGEGSLAFGVGRTGSGIPLHRHGGALLEVTSGRKRWFVAPSEVLPQQQQSQALPADSNNDYEQGKRDYQSSESESSDNNTVLKIEDILREYKYRKIQERRRQNNNHRSQYQQQESESKSDSESDSEYEVEIETKTATSTTRSQKSKRKSSKTSSKKISHISEVLGGQTGLSSLPATTTSLKTSLNKLPNNPPFDPETSSFKWFYNQEDKSSPTIQMCTQNTAEALWLPDNWWHSTLNIGETMFFLLFT